MPTSVTRVSIDPAPSIAKLIGQIAPTEGRSIAFVAQELSYRALFDGHLAGLEYCWVSVRHPVGHDADRRIVSSPNNHQGGVGEARPA